MMMPLNKIPLQEPLGKAEQMDTLTDWWAQDPEQICLVDSLSSQTVLKKVP